MSTFGYDKYETDGLGGWLVFVFLGLVLIPVKLLYSINQVFIAQINSSELIKYVSVESSMYINNYYGLFLYEVIGSLIFVVISCILIFYYFSKHTLFPILFQIFVVLYFLFIGLDYLFVYLMDDLVNNKTGFEFYKELVQASLLMIVGGIYMQVSERVANTFIYDDDDDNNMWAFGVMSIIVLGIMYSVYNIDFSKLSETRKIASIEEVDDGGIAQLNKFYSIDYKDLSIPKLKGFKEIDGYANFGFKTERGVYTFVFSETYDDETKQKFSKMTKDNIIKNLEIYFEDKTGANIYERYVNLKGNQEIYLFEGSLQDNGETVYYHMAFLITENEALDIYSFGPDKKIVNTDGIIFIDNIKIKR